MNPLRQHKQHDEQTVKKKKKCSLDLDIELDLELDLIAWNQARFDTDFQCKICSITRLNDYCRVLQ